MRSWPERITLKDINFAGPDEDIYNVALLNHALPDAEAHQTCHAELGDDLFVMPSLDEPGNSYGGGAAATDSWSNHSLVLEPPPSSLLNMDFDAGLNIDQPERFDMPEMDLEMPDLAAELQQQAEADEQEIEADQHGGEQEEMIAPPAPLTPPTPGEKDQMGTDAGAMNIIKVIPEAEEGQQPQRAAQARKKKRPAGLILDAPEDLLIDRKVYRDWIVSRAGLMTERPKRQRLNDRPADALLLQPASMAVPVPLLGLFKERLTAGPVPADDKEMPTTPATHRQPQSPTVLIRRQAGRHLEDDFFEMQLDEAEGQDEMPAEHEPLHQDEQAVEDVAPDMPTEEELQAMAEEEGLPIEQLRAALSTPGSAAAQQLQQQLGLTPSTSKKSGLASLLARRSRPASSARKPPSSINRPSSDSSWAHRLSGVREDTPSFGDLNPEGHFNDLLLPLPEEDEQLLGPGQLTQFQALGGSLLEATEQQTQLVLEDSINKHTLSMMKVLQKHFSEAERPEGGPPRLSLFALTSTMSKCQAAKIFYQVCVMTSTNFIKAAQKEPYGDIILSPGNRGP
ncbi:g1797 [Coccomyxa elongata]